ncbi:hypothetical protein SP15_071 [Bacillus phage SP-15]|uniref:Uncharacterized protein n=1 Tax=Bacillus phage SP-15 TaxID=1792032 RepID=A0A127AW59_9CAUD|nr:hypothetical protein SP15_071 [Bacillus phage SP-15]AMM44870.1 hypothetical protein SP15_071 [Bacillus phage SP-15]
MKKTPRMTKRERRALQMEAIKKALPEDSKVLNQLIMIVEQNNMDVNNVYNMINMLSLHTSAVSELLIEKGIITQEEIDEKVKKLIEKASDVVAKETAEEITGVANKTSDK